MNTDDLQGLVWIALSVCIAGSQNECGSCGEQCSQMGTSFHKTVSLMLGMCGAPYARFQACSVVTECGRVLTMRSGL